MKKIYLNKISSALFGLTILGCGLFSIEALAATTYNINGILYSVADEAKATAMVYEAADPETLSGDIILPEKVTLDGKEYTLTEIDGAAFKDCSKITSMTLPSTITEIGGQAFNGCSAMKSCNLENTQITTLSVSMFLYCGSLESITIPGTVTTCGINPFMENLSLKEIKVAEGCKALTSVDGVLFSASKKTLLSFPPGKTQNYTIPDGTDTIANSAFCMARNLKNVNFPESVTVIDNSAFLRCDSLQKIELPKYVKKLGSSIFRECKKAKGEIVIPSTCTSMSMNAFYYTAISSLSIPASVKSVPNYTAQYCVQLRKVELEEGLTSIGDYAFGTCNITEINIPNSITKIGNGCFEGSTNLQKVTFGTGIKTINIRAFNKLTRLTEITIGATTPPDYFGTATYPCFTDEVYEKCVLKVPAEALEDYKAVEPWKNFKNIASTSGVEDVMETTATVNKVPGGIEIVGTGNSPVSVFNLAGAVIYQGQATTIELPRAIYIVRVGNKTFKIAL